MTTTATIVDLLAHPSLYPYLIYFRRADYDDLNMLLDMDTDGWHRVLNTVENMASAEQLYMSPGVRDRILLGLRREQVHRQEQTKASIIAANTNHTDNTNNNNNMDKQPRPSIMIMEDKVSHHNRRSSVVLDVSQLPDDSGITKSYVFFQGFSCFDMHWAFCLGLCLLTLIISLFLLLLSQLNNGSSDNEENSDGGWRFMFILMVAGFCLSGVFCVFGACAYVRNPDGDAGAVNPCHESALVLVIMSICASMAACWRELTLPQCCAPPPEPEPEWQCPSCDCECIQLPKCSGENFCPSCDDLYCPHIRMPEISCDCCPSCEDARSCLHTAMKIMTCQCQIQI